MPLIGRDVVGLDIGSYSAKAVELKAGLRSLQLVRAEELRFARDATAEERDASLAQFLEQHGFPGEFVVTAYPANRVTQRHVRFPIVGAKRVRQAIGFEIEEALPFPIDEAVLVHEQVQSGAGQTDALAVLAPRSEVGDYLSALQQLGVDPRLIEIEGTVLGNLAGVWPGFEGPRVLMDIGHSKTNLTLLLEGHPVMLRSLPFGGAHLTEAVAKQTRLGWEAAEEHKHANGLFEGAGTQPVSTEIAGLLDRLVRETARSIQSIVGDPLAPIAPSEILLVGGSTRSSGLATYVEERIDLPCRVLGAPPLSSGLEEISSEMAPGFAQATALALRGAPSARVTKADFRQGEFRYTPDLSGLQGQLRLTAGLFALVLVLWIASLTSELASATARVSRANDQTARVYAQVFPEVSQADLPTNPVAALRDELAAARELAAHLGVTGQGLSVLEILRRIAPKLPENHEVRFSTLRIERSSVRAQGFSKSYEALDRVREQLQEIEGFHDVNLSDVAKVPKANAHRFSLSIQLGSPDE